MQGWVVPVLVAVITGPIVVILQARKFERKNDKQHGENSKLLVAIGDKVDLVATKLDHHIGWHQGRADSGKNEE